MHTATLSTPVVGSSTSISDPSRIGLVRALVSAWALPVNMARRTAHWSLAEVWLLHLLGTALCALAVSLDPLAGILRGWGVPVAIPGSNAGRMNGPTGFDDTTILLTFIVMGLVSLFAACVGAPLCRTTGDFDGRFRFALRQTWLRTPHVAWMMFAMIALGYGITKGREAYGRAGYPVSFFDFGPCEVCHRMNSPHHENDQAFAQRVAEHAAKRAAVPWPFRQGGESEAINRAAIAGSLWIVLAWMYALRSNVPPIASTHTACAGTVGTPC